MQAVIPLLPSLPLLLINFALIGVGLGAFQSGLNPFLSTLWQRPAGVYDGKRLEEEAGGESRTPRQLTFLCLQVGAALAPAILQPFLPSDGFPLSTDLSLNHSSLIASSSQAQEARRHHGGWTILL